ncbi:MAG: helix-turn-helix domain-containing protein, partial [Opitutus sp.]
MLQALPPLFDPADPAGRILHAAHQQLFTLGYQALTMDELAHELGMSKKTLYVHFAGKDAIIERIIDGIGRTLRTRLEAVLDDPDLSFTQKVDGIAGTAGATLAKA